MGQLEGQTALVTGGTSGIGLEIARYMLRAGAKVALFGTNPDKGAAAVAELGAELSGEECRFYAVDVSQSSAVDEAVRQLIVDLGAPTILVNNAGMTDDRLLLRMKEEDWDRVMSVNLKSCFNTCKSLARSMMKARQGKIINISSVVGLQGNAGQASYAASKAGMLGLTKSLARELAPRNICVNCIAPGYIETPMTDALSDEQKQAILTSVPLARMGRSEEIAQAALFLATADYITGQTLVVDGGMVM